MTFRFSLKSLGPLTIPLSGGSVHRFIDRGPNPTISRSPTGSDVYPVMFSRDGGPMGHMGAIVEPPTGPDLNYEFAFSDGTNFGDFSSMTSFYWSDQLA